MDLNALDLLSKIGNVLALTPLSLQDQRPHILRKIYEIFIFILYFTIFIESILESLEYYNNINSIQCVLLVMHDINEFFIIVYVLVIIMRFRRLSWCKMFKSLQSVPDTSEHRYKLVIITSYVIYTLLIVFKVYVNTFSSKIFYFTLVRKEFGAYCQFLHSLLACLILKMILGRYKQQNSILVKMTKTKSLLYPKQIFEILKKIKTNIFVLRGSVEEFNYLFGWTILFVIFLNVSQTLVYLNFVITKHSTDYGSIALIGDVTMSLIHWVEVVTVIFLADTILNQSDKMLAQIYQFENSAINLTIDDQEELQVFIDVIQHNKPEFKAARFFSIDRSTLFSVLNSLTTFLLVMIQFKTS